VTNAFHASKWTDHEVGFAVAQHVLVIPLSVDVDPYGFMASTQPVPAGGVDPGLAQSTFEAFIADGLTAAKMADAVMTAFEDSDTFDAAKLNIQRVKRLRA
jgi:hypothetical protein